MSLFPDNSSLGHIDIILTNTVILSPQVEAFDGYPGCSADIGDKLGMKRHWDRPAILTLYSLCSQEGANRFKDSQVNQGYHV